MMKRLPFEIRELFSGRGIGKQRLAAVREVMKSPAREGWEGPGPYATYAAWHLRFLNLLFHGEIPDWVGFAAFRYITDFNIPSSPDTREPKVFPLRPEEFVAQPTDPDAPNPITKLNEAWLAFEQYFRQRRDLYSGKPSLAGEAEEWFLARIGQYIETLGGQAGNVLWLWDTVGANRRGYTPYLHAGLKKLLESELFDGIRSTPFLTAGDGWAWKDLGSCEAGVRGHDTPPPAPSGGSFVVGKEGRRLIFQIRGCRDLEWQPGFDHPWAKVEFLYDGIPLHEKRLKGIKTGRGDLVWPMVPLFLDAWIEELPDKDEHGNEVRVSTLRINLASDSTVEHAFRGKVDLAVLGGLHALFRDDYQRPGKANPDYSAALQDALVEAARHQMRALRRCGIRMGMELSGIPDPESFRLIQEWCREGVVECLGINGEDELGEMVGSGAVRGKLLDLYLDPGFVPARFQPIARDPKLRNPGFEYVTYLRARKLAEVTGVRTLYVHTTTVDLVLRRDADPGSLLRAQRADMMGKGLTIAALMRRTYGARWPETMRRFPMAVQPHAFARFFEFARDFGQELGTMAAAYRLFESGYWVAPAPEQYSVAAVPVLWPGVEEFARNMPSLPPGKRTAGESGEFSTTGSGDMTFAAFFLLAGV